MQRTHRSLLIPLLALLLAGCSPAARQARHLERADQYFQAGQYDSAEVEYINVLRADPDNVTALHRLGVISFDEGRLSRAVACLAKCEKLEATNLDVRVKLGLIDEASGQIKNARDEADYVLARDPANGEAALLLASAVRTPAEVTEVRQRLLQLPASASVQVAIGSLALRQGDIAAAETALKQAEASDPKSSAAAGALAVLAWSQNDLKKAEEYFKSAADLSPLRSGHRLHYAEFKLQTGDRAGGKAILEEIVKQTPDYLQAWVELAELALDDKKYDEAGAMIDKVLARDSNLYEALILRGRLQVAKGDLVKAASDFEGILAAFPKSAAASYQLALIYLAQNDTGKTISFLNQTLALNPNFPDATMALATLKLKGGDPNGAIALLAPLRQARPPILQAWQLLANAYQAIGDLDSALMQYQQLAAATPKNPQPLESSGLVLLRQNKRAEARQAFEKALAVAPDYFPAVEQLVALDYADKQYTNAQQRVEQLLAREPQQPEAHFLLGKIYVTQHDSQRAEAEWSKALELRPAFTAVSMALANLYFESNRHPLALDTLQAAAQKNPQDVQPLVFTGLIYSRETNYPAARDAYEKALAINPKASSVLNDLAYLYAVQLNQVDKGYELARQARDLAPNDPSTADTLGWILCLKGQYPAALGLLEESAAKLPQIPDVLFHLAVTQYRLGQDAAARRSFEQALQLNQPFEGREEANRCLSVLAVDVKTATANDRAMLEKKLTEKPDDPVIADRLAGIYARDGDVDKAIALYQTALHTNPTNVRAMAGLATVYASQPQGLPQAFDMAKSAYKLAPDDLNVTLLLGRLAYRSGEYKWALSLLQGLAEKMQNDPEFLYDLAEASYSMGLLQDAAMNAQKALAMGDVFSRRVAAKQLIDMLTLARTPTEAVQAAHQIRQILDKSPDNVPALMVLGIISEQKGDAGQARQTYEKILGLYPSFSPAQKHLALLYMADPKENDRAYEMATKAHEAYPDDLTLTRALSITTYRKADYSGAAALLQAWIASTNVDAEVLYYFGMAEYHLKQATQSKQALKRAVELSLPSDMDSEAKRVIAELK